MTLGERIERKVAKACEKEFDLNGYEIRNIYAVAKRRNGGRLVELESGYTNGKVDDFHFITVECHMIDALTGERLDDVIMNCYMADRRRSFITK